jgi:formate hydrogenlyase subunit 3/multisubunit Na+/H+ antiporter MnhD subunit
MTSNPADVLLMIGVTWPLLLALALAFRVTQPVGSALASWAALPTLVACFYLTPGEVQWQFPDMLLGAGLALDAHGRAFLMLAALVWMLSGIYARWFYFQPAQRSRFYLFYLLAVSGNFLLVLAQDALTLYLGYALMSFAFYGLVIFNDNEAALRAGRAYIILVVASELILFEALLLATQTAGSLALDTVRTVLINAHDRDFIMLLVLAGFGIKVALLSVHVWLPLAMESAPAPVSAAIVGTMINAGFLGWMRLLPLGEAAMPEWGASVLVLGFIAVIYATLVGLTQREPKTLVAYAVVGQTGLLTMITALGMLAPQAWPTILWVLSISALHLGLNNTALLLGVGLCSQHYHSLRHWQWAGLWLPALAVAGAPFTGGMLAQTLLHDPVRLTPAPWMTLLPMALFISSVAMAFLMFRLLYLVRPGLKILGDTPPAGLVRTWLIAIVAGLLMPWWLTSTLPELFILHMANSLWPLIVAATIAAIVLRSGMFRNLPTVPAGDVLVLVIPAARWLRRGYARISDIVRVYSKAQKNFNSRLADMVSATLARLK